MSVRVRECGSEGESKGSGAGFKGEGGLVRHE
jgi:hypothetical protein